MKYDYERNYGELYSIVKMQDKDSFSHNKYRLYLGGIYQGDYPTLEEAEMEIRKYIEPALRALGSKQFNLFKGN